MHGVNIIMCYQRSIMYTTAYAGIIHTNKMRGPHMRLSHYILFLIMCNITNVMITHQLTCSVITIIRMTRSLLLNLKCKKNDPAAFPTLPMLKLPQDQNGGYPSSMFRDVVAVIRLNEMGINTRNKHRRLWPIPKVSPRVRSVAA